MFAAGSGALPSSAAATEELLSSAARVRQRVRQQDRHQLALQRPLQAAGFASEGRQQGSARMITLTGQAVLAPSLEALPSHSALHGHVARHLEIECLSVGVLT